ncbi:MAG: Neocarzinostatin family [Actinomycetota bacterium]|nr:Neocarzinostatin family [Actinomycetota bacterium]
MGGAVGGTALGAAPDTTRFGCLPNGETPFGDREQLAGAVGFPHWSRVDSLDQPGAGCSTGCVPVLRRAALLLAICLGVQWAAALPASAARGLTVTPGTGLVNFQTVAVTGSGFTPSVNVSFCQAIEDATPSRADCGAAVPSAFSSPTGAVSGENTVRQTINPSSVGHPVDCWVEQCVMMAWEENDVAGTVVFSPPLTFVRIQPDGQIRRLSDSALIGDDVYNSDASGQTVSHGITDGHDWSFAVQVENDGGRADDISVMAVAEMAHPGIAVRYFAGWFDITSAVTQGRSFTFADVAPGAIRKLVVQFRAASTAPLDAISRQRVTFYVGSPPTILGIDVVRVGVRVLSPA